MSTTRPYSPGDRGPEPSGVSGVPGGGASTASAPRGDAAVPPSGERSAAAPAPPESSGTPGGRQVRRLTFEDQGAVVPLARDFTRQALQAWGWLPAATADRRAAAEDVLLVVSELITNACLHAEGPDQLGIVCDNKMIRLEVTDRGAGQPSPRTPHQAGRPGGHGMFIVQRLCLDWGVVRTPGVPGKTVWAELGAPA
ncbi:ATP-binding protein [Streptomyces prasinopilosus]|uniref:Histidine kinase-like ATPase domain-containing protein n=1 Tax=Streptomyces prasinopilosus TaxID=67344 RepID=A0A1G6RB14_9ACTN|nr:ATP-binding protein [Streptomyces prasinopilosus]SDD01504.1 Histidine kinase-like ATPase domain-containing protein [Streptomyces prasinopilosus]